MNEGSLDKGEMIISLLDHSNILNSYFSNGRTTCIVHHLQDFLDTGVPTSTLKAKGQPSG